MRTLLRWMDAAATRRPRSVAAALVVVTAGCAALATTNEVEVDLTQLSSEDSEAAQAMDRVRERFADPTAVVQVILDAGPGGDVLTVDGLEALAAAQATAVDALGDGVRTDGTGDPQVRSLRTSLDPMLASQGLEPTAVGDAQVGALATRAVTASPQLAALVSDDLDVAGGSARGAAILLLLDPQLTESERTDAGERVREAFEGDRDGALAGLEVTVFSNGVFVTGMLDAIRAEVPLLFGLALLIVLAILGIAYRSVFDVAIGFMGLLATVVCTFGLIALIGPAHLGWAGLLTQLAVVVPVLLSGWGSTTRST